MNSKIKTLVILTPGFPENEADSTCVPPQQIFVKALKEIRPELNIIILTFQYPFFSAAYQWHGMKVISFGGNNKGRLFRLLTNIRVWRTLKKLQKEYQMLGLLSFWFGKCAYIGSRFASTYNLSHYSWILGQDAKAGNKYFSRIKPAAGSLIALSDFIAEEFGKNYGVTPAHLIPVGIDTSMFGTPALERHIDILGAGSLISLKQYHVFLEIIHSLRIVKPDIKALICGDGPEMKRLQQMVQNLGLQDNVCLKGRLNHPQVLEFMQQSRVFLHTSAYEGFGAVCLEALYAGASVVSFVQPMKTPIPNWYIAGSKEGRTKQQEAIEMIKVLLKDQNAQHHPVLPFSIQDNARKMMQLFESDQTDGQL